MGGSCSVLLSSVAHLGPTLCNPVDCSTPGFPVPHQLPKLAQTHVHWVSDAILPSHSLSSPSPPAFNLSQHQDLFHESVLHYRWPKYWSFSFSTSPSNEYSGLISFRIDWFDLLAIQRTLKSPLQHHSSKAVHRSLLSINHTWIMCFIILSKCNYFFQMLHFYFLVFTHLSACICICPMI